MSNEVVILHGWSDSSSSFQPLSSFLREAGFATHSIFLGDYISLRDDVAIDDVAKRMEEVVSRRVGLPPGHENRLGPTFHMVVHSTGGLVARSWIARYYQDRPCPVKNLVMLAPANFGSKLAHKGRTILGRAVKGWRTGFETGEEMLYALELGSPFLWNLARSDLFDLPEETPREPLYGPDRVRPFVIVGTHPYDTFWARITNENGSDGTVRVAAANLNTRGVTVDFTGGPERLTAPALRPWRTRLDEGVRIPLAVLPDRDHSSIANPREPGYAKQETAQARLGELILEALRSRTAHQYEALHRKWHDDVTMDTRTYAGDSAGAREHRADFFSKPGDAEPEYFHEHYQVFVRAVDEFGTPVPDYFMAFMATPKEDGVFRINRDLPRTGALFHTEVVSDVHVHRREPTNRCLYLDRYRLMGRDGFYRRVPQLGGGQQHRELAFTITAAGPGDRVRYFGRDAESQRGLVPLHVLDEEPGVGLEALGATAYRWLKRHTTHFVQVVVPRAAVERVFRLTRFEG